MWETGREISRGGGKGDGKNRHKGVWSRKSVGEVDRAGWGGIHSREGGGGQGRKMRAGEKEWGKGRCGVEESGKGGNG